TMAVHDVNAGVFQARDGIKHVREHRTTTQRLQHLGQAGTHPRALAGREYDRACSHVYPPPENLPFLIVPKQERRRLAAPSRSFHQVFHLTLRRIFSRNLSRATASASSAFARAMSMSPLRSASASSASRLAFSTAASSMSRARSAVSASTVTTLGCTSSTPPETKKLCSSPLSVCTRISPLASRVISGEWRGAMPISPSRSEGHTSELQSRGKLVCPLLLEKK